MTATRPKVYVLLSELGHLLPPGEEGRIVDYARICEEQGAHGVSMGGHVVLGPSSFAKGRLPGAHPPLVPGHIPPDTPQFEPLATLAAIAAATQRVRLDTCILIAALYPPALLAKMATTIDTISGGRLELGIGTSWQEEEFAALGVPFADRGPLTDDALDVLDALWVGGPAHGVFRRAELLGVQCVPGPARSGGIPLWFGGHLIGPVLRRIVSHGSGWLPRPPAAGLEDDLVRLRAALVEAGRDPDGVELRSLLLPDLTNPAEFADLDRALSGAAERVDLGFSTFVIGPAPFCPGPDDLGPFVREVVDHVAALA